MKTLDGDDYCENLTGALKYGLQNLNLSNKLAMIHVFIMTDAPCHGKQYHDFTSTLNDRFLNNVEENSLEKIIGYYYQLSRSVSFTFLKIADA